MTVKGFIFLILIIFTFPQTYLKINQNRNLNDLVGTKWCNEGTSGMPGDTLSFINDSSVKYFLSEVGWEFVSEYKIKDDTLTILTKTQSIEMEDVSKEKPNLRQKFLIYNDTLKLIYLANRRNRAWKEADSIRYERSSDFVKIN